MQLFKRLVVPSGITLFTLLSIGYFICKASSQTYYKAVIVPAIECIADSTSGHRKLSSRIVSLSCELDTMTQDVKYIKALLNRMASSQQKINAKNDINYWEGK